MRFSHEDNNKLETYLVQRLTPPPKTEWSKKASRVFAFGGGGSGLSKEAWDSLQHIFDFDYMGAAEFEFGALPKTLFAMMQGKDDYGCWDFVIKAKDIKPNYDRQRHIDVLRKNEIKEAKDKGLKPPRLNTKKLIEQAKQSPITDKTVYVLGPMKYQSYITDMIYHVGTDKHYSTKNGHRFDTALDPISEYDKKYVGWLDFDNYLAWFMNKDMRDMFAYALGIKSDYVPAEEAPAQKETTGEAPTVT